MKEIYKPLFTPWKIGNVEIKSHCYDFDGEPPFSVGGAHHFDQEAAKFLLERAKNNVGSSCRHRSA
jgi:2-enoate reductase